MRGPLLRTYSGTGVTHQSTKRCGVVTINVVAVNSLQSFTNPATLPAGEWSSGNVLITHRVVVNRVGGHRRHRPGSEFIMAIAVAGQYHCSIHPVMVGSLNQNTSTSLASARARIATEHPAEVDASNGRVRRNARSPRESKAWNRNAVREVKSGRRAIPAPQRSISKFKEKVKR